MKNIATAEKNSLINTQTITSIELAKISWREHKNIMRSIISMNRDLEKMMKPQAVVSSYTSQQWKILPCYILTIYQCELLALALDWIARIKVLDKLEELRESQKPTYELKNFEEYLKIPKEFTKRFLNFLVIENETAISLFKKENEKYLDLVGKIVKIADTMKKMDKKIEELEAENNDLKNNDKRITQWKLFEENFKSLTIPEVAKIFNFSRNNFYKKLRELKFLKLNNEPYKIYEWKYFFVKNVRLGKVKKSSYKKTFVTRSWFEFLKSNLFLKN